MIDFVIYNLLFTKLHVLLAKTISMCCSMIFSYIFNKLWSFSSRSGNIKKEVSRYILVQIVNLLINVTTNFLIFELTKNKIISFIIATGVAMTANYILQRLFVFKKTK